MAPLDSLCRIRSEPGGGAKLLGTDQAKVSLIVNGKVGGFTFDRLVRFLNALEMDVKISVKHNPANKRGKTLVLR